MRLPQRDATILAVIDVQERLLGAFPEEARGQVIRNTGILVESARILGLPILVSEQYPKGLGPTVAELRERLGTAFAPIEKIEFSCGRSPAFRAALETTARRDVLICGVESHVCVLQTAVHLIEDGYAVFVPADAVQSRRALDWERSLRLMEQAGATIGTTETFLFHLLQRAGTDEFRQISRLVK
jgi:nicotinamidase-related amidase